MIKIPYLTYAIFAIPIAMVALPVYVHVPKFYAEELNIPLATIGLVLMCVRILDAAQDPLVGIISDRYRAAKNSRKKHIQYGMPLLVLGLVGIFNPIGENPSSHVIWLTIMLFITYLGLSIVYINYLALGTDLVNGYHQNTQLAASRSFFGMTGILLALVIPEWLANKYGRTVGLSYYSLVFVPILLACLLLVVRKTESPPIKPINQPIGSHIFLPLRNKNFLRLIIVFFLSGMSSAIPGLLILFFVSDILKAPEWGWLAILIYFLTSAIAIPFWANLTKKIGKKKVWLMGMLSAVFSFFWAFFLEDGDIGIFIFICALSGFANGSEITIPVSILADLINKNNVKERSTANASYFGLWQMIEKANLGIAAGVCLPILGVWGYEPNTTESNNFALIAMYSLFPCVIKTFAIITLYYFSIEHDSDKIDT